MSYRKVLARSHSFTVPDKESSQINAMPESPPETDYWESLFSNPANHSTKSEVKVKVRKNGLKSANEHPIHDLQQFKTFFKSASQKAGHSGEDKVKVKVTASGFGGWGSKTGGSDFRVFRNGISASHENLSYSFAENGFDSINEDSENKDPENGERTVPTEKPADSSEGWRFKHAIKLRAPRFTGLPHITVGSEHRNKLTKLKKYITNVNLNFKPIRINRSKPQPATNGEVNVIENAEEKKRKAAERKPSFSHKLLKRFSIKRAFSETDLSRFVGIVKMMS